MTGVDSYGKDVVPIDEFFVWDGPATEILVTCGGTFDKLAGTHRDNIVVRAVPWTGPLQSSRWSSGGRTRTPSNQPDDVPARAVRSLALSSFRCSLKKCRQSTRKKTASILSGSPSVVALFQRSCTVGTS